MAVLDIANYNRLEPAMKNLFQDNYRHKLCEQMSI